MNNRVSRLIGILLAIVVIAVICWPIIRVIVRTTKETELKGAVSNAYRVYLYDDSEHVAHAKDLLFVFDGNVIKVAENDIRNLEVLDEYKGTSRVEVSKPLTEGTYVSGTYMRKIEDGTDFYVVDLKAGDSLVGLYEVSGIFEIEGFEYYGHLEKCDVYVAN